MEHLPLPRGSTLLPSDKITCLISTPYDRGPFLTYPARTNKGHIMTTSNNPPYEQYSTQYFPEARDLAAHLQAWLFFNLLCEVLADRYEPEDSIVRDDTAAGEPHYLQTSTLAGLLEKWIKSTCAARRAVSGNLEGVERVRPPHEPGYLHVASCLNVVMKALLVTYERLDSQLVLSIASTAELIAFATNKAYEVVDFNVDNKCPGIWKVFWNVEKVGSMRESGWCPLEQHFLSKSTYSLQSLFYLSRLKKFSPCRNHKACDANRCIASQISLSRQGARHQSKSCDGSCSWLPNHGKIWSQSLVDILRRGKIPLLQIEGGNTLDELKKSVVESDSKSRYVAFSHVWADGLGNATENKLPRCQLQRLVSLAENLEKTARIQSKLAGLAEKLENPSISDQDLDVQPHDQRLLLWIDTICCPAEEGEGKHLGLAMMRKIYLDAAFVLVVDSEIDEVNVSHPENGDLDEEEIMVRVYHSGWMRRLWTLQEASLGRNLWVQFRDQVINMQEKYLQSSVKIIEAEDIMRHGLRLDMLSLYRSIRVFYHSMEGGLGPTLETLQSQIRRRAVSVASDEPICVAILLGIDVSVLTKAYEKDFDPNVGAMVFDVEKTHQQRMCLLWQQLSARPPAPQCGPKASNRHERSSIPKTIVFHGGMKVEERGYRWAPATLMDPRDSISILPANQHSSQGILSTDGLLVEFSGMVLSVPKRPQGLSPNPFGSILPANFLQIMQSPQQWYSLVLEPPVGRFGHHQQSTVPDLLEIIREGSKKPAHHGCALILEWDVIDKDVAPLLLQSSGCVLVYLQEPAGECNRVKIQNVGKLGRGVLPVPPGLFEIGYHNAMKLRDDALTNEFARIQHEDADQQRELYSAALGKVRQCIRQMAIDGLVKITGQTEGELDAREITYRGLLEEITAMFWEGRYGFIEATVSATQTWCVD